MKLSYVDYTLTLKDFKERLIEAIKAYDIEKIVKILRQQYLPQHYGIEGRKCLIDVVLYSKDILDGVISLDGKRKANCPQARKLLKMIGLIGNKIHIFGKKTSFYSLPELTENEAIEILNLYNDIKIIKSDSPSFNLFKKRVENFIKYILQELKSLDIPRGKLENSPSPNFINVLSKFKLLLKIKDQQYFESFLNKIETRRYLLGALFIDLDWFWSDFDCIFQLGLYLVKNIEFHTTLVKDVITKYYDTPIWGQCNTYDKILYKNSNVTILTQYRYNILIYQNSVSNFVFSRFLDKPLSVLAVDTETINNERLFALSVMYEYWDLVKCFLQHPDIEKNTPFNIYEQDHNICFQQYENLFYTPIYYTIWSDKHKDFDRMKLFLRCPEVMLDCDFVGRKVEEHCFKKTIIRFFLYSQSVYKLQSPVINSLTLPLLNKYTMISLIDDIIVNHPSYPDNRFEDPLFLEFVLNGLSESPVSLDQKKSFIERANKLYKATNPIDKVYIMLKGFAISFKEIEENQLIVEDAIFTLNLPNKVTKRLEQSSSRFK